VASVPTTLRAQPLEPATETADGTAARILDAAERLFAERGIEATSVRTITQAAGANIAAVHYHFGSKQDLVRALLERRVAEMHEARLPWLDASETRAEVTTRDVADAWVRPLAQLAVDPDRSAYLGFLVVLNSGGAEVRSLSAEVFRPQYERFSTLLARALPDVDEPVRWFRFSMAADATIRVLADLDRAVAPWGDAPVETAALVEDLVDAVAGLLAGSPTATTSTVHRSPNHRRS
jgi:AcrR family transcriptional regulator